MWQTILITSNGAWKLGGFGFSISADQSSSDSASVQAFHYAVSHQFLLIFGKYGYYFQLSCGLCLSAVFYALSRYIICSILCF